MRADSARAGLAAFLDRTLREHDSRGVVLLGAAAARWLAPAQFTVPVLQTLSTAEMLADPKRKAQAWDELATQRGLSADEVAAVLLAMAYASVIAD